MVGRPTHKHSKTPRKLFKIRSRSIHFYRYSFVVPTIFEDEPHTAVLMYERDNVILHYTYPNSKIDIIKRGLQKYSRYTLNIFQ